MPVLSAITIIDASAREERVPGVTEDQVKSWVLQGLRSSGSVVLVDKPRPGAYRMKLTFGVGIRDGDRRVAVEARATARDLDSVALQAAAADGLPQASASVLRKVIDAVVADIGFQARLVVCSPARMRQILNTEKDRQRLAAAVGIAGVRRTREAVPALIKLLRHPSEEVADPAIGALVAIGDRRAVPALTRLTKFGNTAKMAKLIDGIGSLGGKEAVEYLELVASGHEDADIRNMASDALERLKRR